MEETPKMETKSCDNCKKDVPIQNYLHHSIHCPRNIRLCPKCDEPYPIIEMDAHMNEDHAEVVCPQCYEFMESVELASHQTDSCPKRMVSCIICEVDLPADTLLDHIDYCGSRSDRCDGCGKTVLMKYQAFHLSSRHAFVKPQTDAQLEEINNSFLQQFNQISSNSRASKTKSNNNDKDSSRAKTSTNTSMSKESNTSTHTNLNQSSSCSNSIGSSSVANTVSNYTPRFVDTNPIQPTRLTATTNGAPLVKTANNNVAPVNNQIALGNKQVTPGNYQVASENKQVTPANNQVAPGNKQVTPENNQIAPGNEQVTPGNNQVASVNTHVAPANNLVAPANILVAPVNNLVAPINNLVAPVNNHVVPADHHVATSRVETKTCSADSTIAECVQSVVSSLKPDQNINESSTNAGANSSPHSGSTVSASSSSQHNAPKVLTAGRLARTQRLVSSSNNDTGHMSNVQHRLVSGGINTESSDANHASSSGQHRSQDSMFKSEVLVPPLSQQKITPVNQAPMKTRKMNFSDDVLNDYMLRLEEQGLSNGLSTESNHVGGNATSTSTTHSEHNTTNSTGNRNIVKARAAEIRRDREQALATGRATNTSSVAPVRSHIAQAINLSQPTDIASLTRLSLAGVNKLPVKKSHSQNIPQNSFVLNIPQDSTNEMAELYDMGLLPRSKNPNRAESIDSERRRGLTRSGSTRSTGTRPNNFEALTHPRPRRDHEPLTRSELRGLNSTLEEDRQERNRNNEDEGSLCLPCEFCDSPIPMDHLILHQTGCRPDLIYH